MIPKIIHQTWKTEEIPGKWKPFQAKLRYLNPDWEYRLWTDAMNSTFVQEHFPDLKPVYEGFPRNIMRADVIRYLIMYKIGGVYLDLDYEVLKPFDFGHSEIVLPLNRSLKSGDDHNGLGNCIFASVPGHRFWKDVIDDLIANPPVINDYHDVIHATGPMLLTRIYQNNRYADVSVPERMIYHPPSPRNRKEYQKIVENGISVGVHHCWGSWRERFSWAYFKSKFFK